MSLPGHTFTPLFSHVLPTDSSKVVVGLKVRYEGGAVTPTHHHGEAFVVGTVLSGTIRSVVHQPGAKEAEEEKILSTSDTWSELPGALHAVSANNSQTEPAEFMAVFVAPSEQSEFVVFNCEMCKVAKDAAGQAK
ncbi:hypothetical protein E3P81_02670 [Wallemia ichthyophaga]|nr:hypothetical protein E3P97_02741 [Wallemia ichthyophaga]TIB31146.1 hypothetical protein E3P85_02443 [Wallemia ichthyophaga]TIB45631.1 hypothetical protein E3P82_02718 [Wallemia ichthyophaga]TIB48954.1 hypothetical protein E3P81_02670 [Wallemia ichthyophaga]TIB52256.1 hypothetical protein E3P80_02720 [Wallemia ichthyophaga]